MRNDAAIARLWAATSSKDGNPKPLLPWPRPDDPEPASAETVLAYLTASMKKKD
jgi:hypothetical protein